MEDDTENNVEEKPSEVKEKYVFPSIDLLSEINNSSELDNVKENEDIIQNTLHSFGINVKMVNSNVGPIATIYEIELLGNKVRVSDVKKLKADIGMALGREVINIDRIPGESLLGIEVKNVKREIVSFKELINGKDYKNAGDYTIVLGKDYYGNTRLLDISKMTHMLVAGTTGSGKSMFIHSLILSLIYKCSPDLIKLLLIDTKAVELINYGKLPHMLLPTITDSRKASGALAWAVMEMENRYILFNELNVKNINDYNEKLEKQEDSTYKKMPQLIIVIDELADLMMTSAYEVEDCIIRLAQKARAAGIHLVLVTQRPSVKVVTGLIKANLNNRIAFKTASAVDSVTVLDKSGAEELLGYGDYLYKSSDEIISDRIECPFIPEEDVRKIIEFVADNNNYNNYDKTIIDVLEKNSINSKYQNEEDDRPDPLLNEAIDLVINSGSASTSFIQRRFKVNYARAGRIIDQMEERGIISGYAGSSPREVFISKERWEELKSKNDNNRENIINQTSNKEQKSKNEIKNTVAYKKNNNNRLEKNRKARLTSLSQRIWGIIIGIVFLTFTIHNLNVYKEENSWTRIDYNGLPTMSFRQIKQEASKNIFEARERYINNVYIFTGTIESINGREIIISGENGDYTDSYIYINNEDMEKLEKYKPGDSITIAGTVTKISVYYKVYVKKATIVE